MVDIKEMFTNIIQSYLYNLDIVQLKSMIINLANHYKYIVFYLH